MWQFLTALVTAIGAGVVQGLATAKETHASLMGMPAKTTTVRDAIAADDAEFARRKSAKEGQS